MNKASSNKPEHLPVDEDPTVVAYRFISNSKQNANVRFGGVFQAGKAYPAGTPFVEVMGELGGAYVSFISITAKGGIEVWKKSTREARTARPVAISM